MLQFDISQFIKKHVTNRTESFFEADFKNNHAILSKKVKGQRVLVIGGAGTIGSSFIKALLPFKPGSLTVVDYSENGLTELTRDLRSQEIFMPKEYLTYPFDFGSTVFEKLMAQNTFDIVACFAAHKHVRSEKDHLAIEAMINNNVFNTKKLIDLALKKKPKHFFSVSTDKAANPVNVMGASKKLMEHTLLAHSNELKISTARFANVAFSNGSLLAGFIERVMKRQPLSAPLDVKRYFVSPEESGQLCLLACLLGDSGDIFFPKLREDQMLSFSHIAEIFLTEIGLKADYCHSESQARQKASVWDTSNINYPVYFFPTDTSGEKKYEEFYTQEDRLDMNRFRALGIIKKGKTHSISSVNELMSEFRDLFKSDDVFKPRIIKLISKHLSDFSHIETGKSLDQKM